MRYRFHRSPLLWIGLFGLVFLLWAWAGSTRKRTEAEYSPGGRHLWNIYQRPSLIAITRNTFALGTPAAFARQFSHRSSVLPVSSSPVPLFPVPYYSAAGDEQSAKPGELIFRELVIPYWLLVLVYLAAWSGLIAWRWRRAARATTSRP